jgi:hypothetical protein
VPRSGRSRSLRRIISNTSFWIRKGSDLLNADAGDVIKSIKYFGSFGGLWRRLEISAIHWTPFRSYVPLPKMRIAFSKTLATL